MPLGDPKPLHFYNAFRTGYLQKYRSKILYIHMNSIPKKFVQDGWLAEAHIRNFMSTNALEKIRGLQGEQRICERLRLML